MNVVLVAPYFAASMSTVTRAFLNLRGVRVGVITHQENKSIPADIRKRLAGHYKITNALDPEQLAKGVRAFQASWGVVDRLEGYLEQLQVPLGEARDRTGLDGISGAVAKNFRDKNRMKEVLRKAGLPVARQARVCSAADARRFVKEVGYPVVLKPLDGAGARGTVRVHDDASLMSGLNVLYPSAKNPIQAEEFITGSEHTLETVVINGEPVWSSSTHYIPGPLAVLENPWMQYCLLQPRHREEQPKAVDFKKINARALAALGLKNGISHMEWFSRKDGTPVIGEVGARPPGANILDVIGLCHDVDMWPYWARLQVFREWNLPEKRYAAGCAFLRAQGPGKQVTRLIGLEKAKQAIGERWMKARLPRVGQPVVSGYEGEGFILVRAETTAEVVEALGHCIQTLKVVAD